MWNFPVNDDWIFVRQVEAFIDGNYTISAILDPTFILQGLIGKIWGHLFGISFLSSKILTLLFSFLFLYGVFKLLTLLQINKKIKILTIFLLALNPLILTSSFTFMTDVYFLVFLTWGVYFFIKWIDFNNPRTLLIASVLTGLSILIRQVGVVTAIAMLIVILFGKLVFKQKLKNLALLLIPVIISILIFKFWPKYIEPGVIPNFYGKTVDLDKIGERITEMVYSLVYYGFFLSPLLLALKTEYSKKTKVLILVLSLVLSSHIYQFDVFRSGNVFYIEGLYAKSGFRSNLSIFDNVFFKPLLTFFISYSTLLLFSIVLKNIKKTLKNQKSLLTLLLFAGHFSVLTFSSDFYDRYFLSAFFALLIYTLLVENKWRKNLTYSIMSIVLLGIMSVFLQIDYFGHTTLRWEQARKLQQDTGIVTGIDVDGTYAKYFNAVKKKDYTGTIRTEPGGIRRCYVQKYTMDTNAALVRLFDTPNEFLKRYIENPRIFDSTKKTNLPKIKKHFDELLYNEEYFSPLYNLVGKKTYVGAWCNENEL